MFHYLRWQKNCSAAKCRREVRTTQALKEPGVSPLSLEKYYKDVEYIARSVARRVPPNVSLDDLISAGYLGLVDAAHKFDSGRESSFRTYALHRVRGAIADELRRHDVIPRLARIELKKLQKARDELAARTGAVADLDTLARHLGFTNEKVEQLLVWDAVNTASLDGTSLGHCLEKEDTRLPGADVRLEEDEMKKVVRASLHKLAARDAQIVDAVFFRDMKLRQVARKFKVTESRISQIVSAALKQLKKSRSLNEHIAV